MVFRKSRMGNRIREKEGKLMKDIYIIHEYEAKSHFMAMYNREEFTIKEFIVIDQYYFLKQCIKKTLKNKNIKYIIEFYKNFIKNLNISKIKGKNLIVGIAPYNKKIKK